MNVSKKVKYFSTGLVLAVSLFFVSPFQGNVFAQHSATPPTGITMKAVAGKVVQTMDSGGYTYALVEEKGDDQTWVALPQSQIAVGDEISCRSGMVMNNFTSKSLGRTFDHIVFSGGLLSGGSAAASPAATAPAQTVMPSKYKNAKSYTVAEIFDKKASLAFQPVAVTGKVVKVNSGIMGKNWLHLQDGTGSKEAGNNDLVVTTDSGLAKVGDTVTIKGKLSLDRDFGSGYHYDVMVEGAEVTIDK